MFFALTETHDSMQYLLEATLFGNQEVRKMKRAGWFLTSVLEFLKPDFELFRLLTYGELMRKR
jgi:hypothetical protein